MGAIVSGGVV